MTNDFDVAIIGGGIAGFSLAHFLSPHRKTVVLEREDAFGYHATGRSAAEFAFRGHTELVGRLAALSFPFFTDTPAGFAEHPLLKERGLIAVAPPEKRDRLLETFERDSRISDRLLLLSKDEVLARAPVVNPAFFEAAFFDPDCWDIDVEALFQGFQRSARARGAVAHRKAEVIGATRRNGVWEIETRAGTFRAPTVVNAAGAWADEVAALFGARPLGLTPLNRTVITVPMPEGVDWQAMPEVQDLDEDFYMKPDAGNLLLSPADENESAPCDAQPEELGIAWAMHWLNEATTVRAARPAHAWAGLRTFAPDRAPVVGWDGQVEGLFWLAGQGGFGIQTAPALGELAARLIADARVSEGFRRAGVEEGAFKPGRFG